MMFGQLSIPFLRQHHVVTKVQIKRNVLMRNMKESLLEQNIAVPG